eukprot:TRINITY_DN22182_c0_g1_i1.p1 TRINITY_DN22182_c0_g1~~TRINITY_DN22182_c0_g1_i1.p1  ORF type:complete len:593 (-),score=157.27 TRINITY_DN22182_c0_g1_i1:61-1785(-)
MEGNGTGADMIIKCLHALGAKHMFGVVGIPVTQIALSAHASNLIDFYGFRNEQPASYAAGAYGYLTQSPGLCLVVSGPGLIHGLAGLSNAWANHWPMILMAGRNDTDLNDMGAFQESPQIELCRPFTKLAVRCESISRIPFYLEKCWRYAITGRPGPVYIEFPGDVITATSSTPIPLPKLAPIPIPNLIPQSTIDSAISLLSSAKRPLVILGKGAAYSRAESQIRQFLSTTNIPFVPTPMGKGVAPDSSPQNVITCRSYALQNADVVLLLGARLNWILHFGAHPRWSKTVQFIQVDISAEELGNNAANNTTIPIQGDISTVITQFNSTLAKTSNIGSQFKSNSEAWYKNLKQSMSKNITTVQNMSKRSPEQERNHERMNYYQALSTIQTAAYSAVSDNQIMIVSEGANTMDIGRSLFPNEHPRQRLDAGTFGTMGVGFGFAIASAVVHPDLPVLLLQGDSAFGFSAMEIETMVRYGLKVTVVIINNNGITHGTDQKRDRVMPNELTVEARYEKMGEVLGGKGWFVKDGVEECRKSIEEAMRAKEAVKVVNVMISTASGRKEQEFGWHSRKENKL